MATNQRIFDAILTEIASGKIKAGDHLVEGDLAPMLGVSRTPVREAIRRLDSFGIVKCSPNKGAVVTKLSPGDIESLYTVRLTLERLVAKLSFPNIGPEQVERLKQINGKLQLCSKKGSAVDLIENDRHFHHTIYEASNNLFLAEVLTELRLKAYVIAYHAWSNPERIKTSITEHAEIIGAVEHGKKAMFQSLLERQLIAAKAFYLNYID